MLFGPVECPYCPGARHWPQACGNTPEARAKRQAALLKAFEEIRPPLRALIFPPAIPLERQVRILREAVKDDVGSHVVFTDPTGREHDALITAVWGPQCINCVYVLKDEKQTDQYGRKTNKQYTSIMHGNLQQAHGNFWMWPGEERDSKMAPKWAEPNPVTA